MAFETDQKISFLETIHTIYPGIDIRSARQLTHDGEFNDIFIINDELVFRFPRFPENIPDFLREMELLTRLQGRLPLPIPNPIYTSSAPEKVCMGYRLIPGQPLQPDLMNRITNEAIIQGLAKQLADFLFILHHLTPGTLGLDFPLQNMLAWVSTFYGEVREQLFAHMRREACLALTGHFDHYFKTRDLQNYTPVIIHGDFGGSNILFEDDLLRGHDDHGDGISLRLRIGRTVDHGLPRSRRRIVERVHAKTIVRVLHVVQPRVRHRVRRYEKRAVRHPELERRSVRHHRHLARRRTRHHERSFDRLVRPEITVLRQHDAHHRIALRRGLLRPERE